MICNFGLRPKFAPGTPDCYVELTNQCMSSYSDKRPNVREIINKLNQWSIIVEDDIENVNDIDIKMRVISMRVISKSKMRVISKSKMRVIPISKI
ncbi:hypothetical protein C2G38_90838 [Gigaspora rosea]|uniref:Serine-threonine/tyrosine-protein kinase catalytic domain-containing protein n=1 Tax=Gigaspora rosea TaxID=44941 RepID=A0A397VX08_9GLOM|nr:hypothetical protein C2G38_90838 [Gigaspora rosea]